MEIYVEQDLDPPPSSSQPRTSAGLTQRNRNVIGSTFNKLKKLGAGGGSKGPLFKPKQQKNEEEGKVEEEEPTVFRAANVSSPSSKRPSVGELYSRSPPVKFDDSKLTNGQELPIDMVWDGEVGGEEVSIFRESDLTSDARSSIPQINLSPALSPHFPPPSPNHHNVFRSTPGDGPTLHLAHPILDPDTEEEIGSINGSINESSCSIDGIGFLSDSEVLNESDGFLNDDEENTQVLFVTDGTNIDNDSMFSIHSFFSSFSPPTVSPRLDDEHGFIEPFGDEPETQRNSRAVALFGIALGIVAFNGMSAAASGE
ncbi:hypothetical protein TrLO_g6471 [Triparma laevis f. longispina]|uniref:Uncharacterized protein n=1 Tax=Triparma laevis f. longispina TaxID=1714387 RepID=A0A9W7F9E2_9STRA|nr:hypothetical protein TrLO_g6471 [Triparma laevis f. longispina]